MPILAFVLALSSLVCQRNQNQSLNQQNLNRVILRFVDVELESPVHVDCDALESYFGSDVDTLVIDDRPFLDSLASVVADLQPSDKGFTPDVRIIVEMYFSNGAKKILCVSNVALALDGREMRHEPKLLALLQNKTDRKKN